VSKITLSLKFRFVKMILLKTIIHTRNAYGMANTLLQTAFRPKLKAKVGNLYFTGQLTVPGPGVPPALISGTGVRFN
jgi:phytoene dehydrogenase-like protein